MIVINDQDAKTAWSLLRFHELVHLWLGTPRALAVPDSGAQIEQYACNECRRGDFASFQWRS